MMRNILEPRLNKTNHRTRMQLENLEARIAPTTIVGGDYFGCTSDKGHFNPQGKWVGGGKHVLCGSGGIYA